MTDRKLRYPPPIIGFAIVGSIAAGLEASSYGPTPFQQRALGMVFLASGVGALLSVLRRKPARNDIVRIALVVITTFASTFGFVGNFTINQTSELIDRQNRQALHLWSETQSVQNSEQSRRILQELMELSQRNRRLLNLSYRLNTWWMPNRPQYSLTFEELVDYPESNPALDRHLEAPPDIANIKSAVVKQIETYERIRDFALDLMKFSVIVYAGLAFYVLPVLYGLLGCSLRSLRPRSYTAETKHTEQLARAHYFISALAGLLIGILSSLLPIGGFATALFVGWSIPIVISALASFASFVAGNTLKMVFVARSRSDR